MFCFFFYFLFYNGVLTDWGFPSGAPVVKSPPAKAGDIRDASSIPGLGRSPGGGHGNPLQCSYPENLMAREEPGGLQSMGLNRVRHR